MKCFHENRCSGHFLELKIQEWKFEFFIWKKMQAERSRKKCDMTENSVPVVPCCESGFGKNFTAAGISLPDTDQPFSSSGTVLVQDPDPRLRIVFPYPESHQHYANPQNSFFVRVITVGICPEPKKQNFTCSAVINFYQRK